jgi:alpha(1,3/1,4) fucosyltransferase
MMKTATLVVGAPYNNNKIFDLNNTLLNRDNCLFPFFLLKQELGEVNVSLSTQDILPVSKADYVIYNEMPKYLPKKNNIKKSSLIIFESEIIRSDNWDLSKHEYFHKIFTWNDDYIDNNKYFKINFSQKLPDLNFLDFNDKSKLLVLIAGNKSSTHKNELYSKRKDVIKWYENNQFRYFDLYGVGWGQADYSNSFFLKALKKLDLLKFWPHKIPQCYQGRIESKYEVLNQYKFAICFENAKKITGYITEKIFDCFFAGCVPVYWGAPNITQHIPASCFIDFTKFNSIDELNTYINNIDKEEYHQYQNNILEFLNNNKFKQFSANDFAKTIVANL